ncbi:MAG: hypothetical protein JF587_18435 [Catenulisporales bacterium]|jgi:primosomal protein N''|nr:hypothetical protein [Catenulisporales bacterium]
MANEFDVHAAAPAGPGRPARPRAVTLLDDEVRAAFLAEWDSVQTGFVADPRRAAEAAEQLVDKLADSVIDRIDAIRSGVTAPVVRRQDQRPAAADPLDDGAAAGGLEQERERLLRCREAFHLLIDS